MAIKHQYVYICSAGHTTTIEDLDDLPSECYCGRDWKLVEVVSIDTDNLERDLNDE
jgi:hypothetical protein